MTREEKCLEAIKRGYTYNPVTGKVYGPTGIEVTRVVVDYYAINLKVNKKQYMLQVHQFAWYYINKNIVQEIDHINQDKLDNRLSNLREVTHQQNMWNCNTTKGYKYDKRSKKYEARIIVGGKYKHLGTFDTEKEAREAYINAKLTLHRI